MVGILGFVVSGLFVSEIMSLIPQCYLLSNGIVQFILIIVFKFVKCCCRIYVVPPVTISEKIESAGMSFNV